MTKYLVACVLVLVACKKKEEGVAAGPAPGSAVGSAAGSAAPTPSEPTPAAAEAAAPKPAAAKPADLPPASAPGTPEILAKFDAACDGGYGPACFDSGMRRAKGMGTAADRPAATAWLDKGCTLDDAESCGLLAGFVATGQEGVRQDKAKAIELHAKACPKRPVSCRLLAAYYGRGEIVTKDLAKAMSLLDQACKAGDQDACKQAADHRASGTDK
jgi:hypothetical protein